MLTKICVLELSDLYLNADYVNFNGTAKFVAATQRPTTYEVHI
jgi:hypothetical protein